MIQIKEILMATSVAALLIGCVDTSTGAAARADMEGETKVEIKAEPAPKAEEKAPVAEKAEPAPVAEASTPVETAAPAPVEEVAPAAEPAAPATASVDLSACLACHGASFEKVAMGVSKVVKDMSKDEIVAALKGYQDGSYGASMKALMKGQVAGWDAAKIDAAAAQIVGQ